MQAVVFLIKLNDIEGQGHIVIKYNITKRTIMEDFIIQYLWQLGFVIVPYKLDHITCHITLTMISDLFN